MIDKHFINLSNGLETVPLLDKENLNFCYIASTTLERKAYLKLFTDLDHNLLFNLSIGNTCYFYDYGTNRPFSKTCYLGVPLIVYCLTRLWLGRDHKELAYRFCRRGLNKFNEYEMFNRIYSNLFLYNSTKEKEWMKTKLKKYKNKFLFTSEIKLIAVSKSTTHDGNCDYYREIIKTNLL